MIKLAAFDVDGTLRDRDYLPDSTREALKKLKEHGVQLALCTGRPEFEMASLRQELGIDWAVTCNGSHIGYRGQTVVGNPFPQETIRRWLAEAERSNHYLLLYGADLMYCNGADDSLFRQAQQEIGFMEPIPLDTAGDIPDMFQVIVFCTEEDEYVYTGKGDERAGYYLHRWRPWALDINPNGRHKAIGLSLLLDHLGIAPEEAAAFGDGGNDYELLQAVGTGIAMGNADDRLKHVAKRVTRSLHEDGIAYAVNEWLVKK
ncbi:Cof-type HAD-IIB family hydrolase [Paenibacillus silviterrae]|uniref:Cof-type HAD-IIB family hydrolase n=1 Tax=Paenibacillus silviterrae TaxID=3242194 RepID=UPI002542D015|nr:Cof-type HAD-IIB family hydrolase [Paenibacillus chinjuensis]